MDLKPQCTQPIHAPLRVHTHIRMLQRLTAQSKQRARMWTSELSNVQPGALGYTEPEAPGDREHARGRPYPCSKHNDLSVRDVAATCFDVCAKVLIAIDRVSQTAPLRLSSVVFKHRMGTRRKRVDSYRFPLPTVCFEC
jgi:hypothetical protein